MSDVLANGESARLHQRLVKEQQLFSEIDTYVLGSLDEGLFIIEGKLKSSTEIERAEAAIAAEISELKNRIVSRQELDKVKNMNESLWAFSQTSVMNKAYFLAYYELLGDANAINHEMEKYLAIDADQIRDCAHKILRPENCSTLHYLAK